MKLYSLSVLEVPASGQSTVASTASDLSSFSFYQRGSVAEFMTFFSKTVAERTKPGQRQSVEENNYVAHVYNRGGTQPLAAVVIADKDYPVRPAFSLLTKVLEHYTTNPPDANGTKSVDGSGPFDPQWYLNKWQDPAKADAITQVQAELDETKIILHKTIESVLERGEKLDNLVDKSNALSQSSKAFYKTAKTKNGCCVIM